MTAISETIAIFRRMHQLADFSGAVAAKANKHQVILTPEQIRSLDVAYQEIGLLLKVTARDTGEKT